MSINPREFLNTAEELHALVIGLCEVVCPWKPRQEFLAPENVKDLTTEPYYYHLGRALGVFVWLGIIALLKEIVC